MTTFFIPDYEVTGKTHAGLKQIKERLLGNYLGLTRATDDDVFAIVFGHFLSQFADAKLGGGREVNRELRSRVSHKLRSDWVGLDLLTDDIQRPAAPNLLAPDFSSQEDVLGYVKERAQRAYNFVANLPSPQEELEEILDAVDDGTLIDACCLFIASNEKRFGDGLSESAVSELRRRIDDSRAAKGKPRLFPGLENTTQMDDLELGDFTRKFELASIARREIRGQDFSGQNLDGKDFRNVDFIDCIFNDSSCIETRFDGSHFIGTGLTMSNFDSASLNSAVFAEGSRLEGTNFAYAKLRFTVLKGVQAKGADFGWADLYKADLSHAELTEVYFEEANLTDTLFAGATGTFTHFEKAKLDRTDFRNCLFNAPQMPGLDFGNSRLENGSFGGGIFIGCQFEGTSLRGANFDGALWGSSDFTDVDLSECVIDNRFMDCTLTNTNMTKLDLRNGDFHLTKFDETVCDETNFSGVYFKETRFNGVRFSRANLTKTQFEKIEGNVLFLECDLSGSIFSHCELYGPEFRNCNLSDAQINISSLDEVQFEGGTYKGLACENSNFDYGQFEGLDLTTALFTRCTFIETQVVGCLAHPSGFVDCEPAGDEFPFTWEIDHGEEDLSLGASPQGVTPESFDVATPIPILISPKTGSFISTDKPVPTSPIVECFSENRDFRIPVSYEDIYTAEVMDFERAFIATLAQAMSVPSSLAAIVKMPTDQGGVYVRYERHIDGSITVYMMSNYDLWEPKEEWFRAVMTNLEWFALRLSIPGKIAYRKSWGADAAPWHVANAVSLAAVHVFDVLRDGLPTPLYQWPGDSRVAVFAHKHGLAEPLHFFGVDETTAHTAIQMDLARFPEIIKNESSPATETISSIARINEAYDVAANNDDELGMYSLKYLAQRLRERAKFEQTWMNDISEMILGGPSGVQIIIDDFSADSTGPRVVTDIAMLNESDLAMYVGDGNFAALQEIMRRNPDLNS